MVNEEDMPNPKELLGEIFTLTLKSILKKLRSGDVSAADVSAIRSLLKDNGISAIPVEGTPLQEVAMELSDVSRYPFGDFNQLPVDDPATDKNLGGVG